MKTREIKLADAAACAALHALCFSGADLWSAAQFAGSLELPTTGGDLVEQDGRVIALCLTQIVEDEVEILTICVDPACRGQGIGAGLLAVAQAKAGQGTTLFLEVAADNGGAIRLYERFGFSLFSRRPAYYRRVEGAVDALNYRYLVNDKC